MFEKHEVVEILKARYTAGTRVTLLKMDDPQAPPKGTCQLSPDDNPCSGSYLESIDCTYV